jgi:hypothetical protein
MSTELYGSVLTLIFRLMSALGQSQTFDDVCITSAFPLMATKSRTSHHVGDGPKADIAPAFLTVENFATWGDQKQKPRMLGASA